MRISTHFRFYESAVRVTGPAEFVHRLEQDFHYFRHSESAQVQFSMEISAETPKWRRRFTIGDYTFFRSPSGVRRVCFFKKTFVEYRYPYSATVLGTDFDSCYEAAFLTLLSFVGESLDEKGWHRLHGYGLRWRGRGTVILAGSGVGKSTLALEMLDHTSAEILSDDTPLVAGATMRAFPQRIAVRERPLLDARFLHQFRRHGHGEKYVVSSAYFEQKVCPESSVDWLLLAKRSSRSEVKRVARWRAVWPVIKWLVFGYETPQIWPLYVRSLPRKWNILINRIRVGRRLLASAQVAELALGPSTSENRQSLEAFYGEAM